MKIIKTASGNQIKMSKSEWESIGKQADWMDSLMEEEEYGSQEEYDDFHNPSKDLKAVKLPSPSAIMTVTEGTMWEADIKSWEGYLARGNVYLVSQDGKPYALWHPESGQCKDTLDRSIEGEELVRIQELIRG